MDDMSLDLTLDELSKRNNSLRRQRQHGGRRRQRNFHEDHHNEDRRKRARRDHSHYGSARRHFSSDPPLHRQRPHFRTNNSYHTQRGGGSRGARNGGNGGNATNFRSNHGNDSVPDDRFRRPQRAQHSHWGSRRGQSGGPQRHHQTHRTRTVSARPRGRADSLPRPARPSKNYYIRSAAASPSDPGEDSAGGGHLGGYVTLVMKGDHYIPGALILAHSLRLVESTQPLLAMVTDDVSLRARDALRLLFDFVVEVPYVEYQGHCKRMKTEKQQEKYKEWASGSFTKWNILNLNELMKGSNVRFRKLLFLDSDKIVLRNIDHLFTDRALRCPAGTFSSPWTNRRCTNGLVDYYPDGIQHGDEVPATSIFDALYNSGFVAVGTGMLLRPNGAEYTKFIEMLDRKWVSDEYLDNSIDRERARMRRLRGKFAVRTAPSTEAQAAGEAEGALSENEQPAAVGAVAVDTDFPDAAEPAPSTKTGAEPSPSPVSKMLAEEKASGRTIGFRNCYSMLDEQSIVFFYFYHKVPWHYLDVRYNFIPWHFKWLQRDDGSLAIPSVLHFFGTKPWVQSPVEWRDLQVWWGMVFHLLNYSTRSVDASDSADGAATDPMYRWDAAQCQLMESFFDLDLMNKLPLEIFVDGQADFEEDECQKRGNSGVRCFWCYELAKRKGLDPDRLIKEHSFAAIEWIFHCPVDPLSGKLFCPKLLDTTHDADGAKAAEGTEAAEGDGAHSGAPRADPVRPLPHEEDEEGGDELAESINL